MPRPKNERLREFLLTQVNAHPKDLVALAMQQFGLSRTAVNRLLRRLVDEGLIATEGEKRAREYTLKWTIQASDTVVLTPDLEDDTIWRIVIRPKMADIPTNIIDICHYGFTEMFNNVIDHSRSDRCLYWYSTAYNKIRLGIRDYGIGIFEKIRHDFSLNDRRHAILELSKGKLTSDSSRHSGEGIFFTSRMFDKFSISSLDLHYSRWREQSDAEGMIEVDQLPDETGGTLVLMTIARDTERTAQEVFEKYVDDDLRFAKTHVPLKLAKIGEDQLVSRSQARRLLARFERFSEVLLDFNGIKTVGQAFADEVFRVFQADHPEVRILAFNTTRAVEKMIAHARANAMENREQRGGQ